MKHAEATRARPIPAERTPASAVAPARRARADDLRGRADRLIGAVDETLSRQVDAIIHHPRFMRLEASWRQLERLARAPHGREVVLRVLPVSWRELARDAARAAEFDQTRLFDLVYSSEFDMPGGLPFGMLVGDFAVTAGIHPEHGTDDVEVLSAVAAVAAAAFAPFVCSAAPELLDVRAFAELDRELDMAYLQGMDANVRWDRLRRQLDARFLGVVVPRVLVRPPYRPADPRRRDGFVYRERVAPDGTTLLWGGAAFAFAETVIAEFDASGWFADIRGARASDRGGGLVADRPTIRFDTDASGRAAQPPVEIRFTPSQEQMLASFGLVPLMPLAYSTDCVFNTNQSLHLPPRYDEEAATQNARIAAMLQYVLCACRFAHYLKLIMRENVGQVTTADQLRAMLNDWLSAYTLGNDDAEAATKARFPLRSASVALREVAGQPGVYACVVQLQPHFQLDDVSASFQLLADMTGRGASGSNAA